MANTTSPEIPVPPPLTYLHRTYLLPSTDTPTLPLSFLAGKFSALSLRALSTDPASFGQTYSTEATFPPSTWTARITRPNIQIFICVAHASTTPAEAQTLAHGSWIGMVTQIGPTPKATFWLPESGAPPPLPDATETKFHQTALWIEPAHRGQGVAKQLIEAGVAHSRQSIGGGGGGGSVTQARVRAMTGPANEESKRLYAGRGFPAVGKCTIAEAVVANGNGEWGFWGRWDWGAGIMEMRVGVVMERVVRRAGEGEMWEM